MKLQCLHHKELNVLPLENRQLQSFLRLSDSGFVKRRLMTVYFTKHVSTPFA
jgi:hypothetical protein